MMLLLAEPEQNIANESTLGPPDTSRPYVLLTAAWQ